MPRPGPRPYECVRRAWHSDRHQPIRGSLIQEIFRVVNETHSSATKKNKEWQEKLPIVVLKAEEIMYSKANSEAEYMDLKTLWDRTNDAINTIIRLDETTESGNFLQPCIEAALNLGCMPRRASRSQRNSFPGCYLSSSSQGPNNVSPSAVDKPAQRNLRASSQCVVNHSNFGKSGTISATYSGAKLTSPIVENVNRTANKFPFSCERFTPATNSVCLLGEAICPSSKCSVYPLYQGDRLESEAPNPKYGYGLGAKSSSFKMEPVATDSIQNGLSSIVDASNKHVDQGVKDITESACDLALRLGPISIPCSSVETGGPLEVEEGGSTSSREGSKLTDLSIHIFRKCNTDYPTDSGSSKVTTEDELSNGNATTRKRKAVCGNRMEDQLFSWQSKLSHVHHAGRMEKTGL